MILIPLHGSTRPFFVSKMVKKPPNTLSRPASQNTREWGRDESRRRIYTRKIPHVYTLSLNKLKQAINLTIINHGYCNATYKQPRMISYESRARIVTGIRTELIWMIDFHLLLTSITLLLESILPIIPIRCSR